MTIKLSAANLRALKTIKEEHRITENAAALSFALKKVAREIRQAKRDRIIRF
jgi:hypothetical protein